MAACGARQNPGGKDWKDLAAKVYTEAMETEEKLAKLAQQYLDLWQNQMTALANDPEIARSLETLYAGLGLSPQEAGGGAGPALDPKMAAAWQSWPALLAAFAGQMLENEKGANKTGEVAGEAGESDARKEHGGSERGKTGPAAAAAQSDGGRPNLDELTRRLALLEQQIFAMESGSDGRGGSASD
jgi:hypothetical protein